MCKDKSDNINLTTTVPINYLKIKFEKKLFNLNGFYSVLERALQMFTGLHGLPLHVHVNMTERLSCCNPQVSSTRRIELNYWGSSL